MKTPQELLEVLVRAEREAPSPSADARGRVLQGVLANPVRPDATLSSANPTFPSPTLPNPTGLARLVSVVIAEVIGVGLFFAVVGPEPSRPQPADSAPTSPIPESRHASPARSPLAAPVRADPEPSDRSDNHGEPDSDEPAPRSMARRPRAPDPRESPVEPERAPVEDELSELALLDAMLRAQMNGDDNLARELAAELERRFPSGRFIEERLATQARVLCRTGAKAEGRELVAQFERRWPNSMHLAGLRHDCETPPTEPDETGH